MAASPPRHYMYLLALCVLVFCDAFAPSCQDYRRVCVRLMARDGHGDPSDKSSRRQFLGLAVSSLLIVPSSASAADELFKPNPLTNPLLEQIRIWEQAEADDIKYGGELTPGDAGNKGRVEQYPALLVPILSMEEELRKVDALIHGTKTDWKEAYKIMQQPKYDKIAFKATFNRFADNIYYGDPERANAYLGGGATPKAEQSIAYLLRNEILTNIESLQAELAYLLKETDDDTEDLYKYSSSANSAMKDYLANVSPYELKKAKELLLTNERQS
ncbi:expressed unknown protein [Seminavis robusta]|uniref:Uncharacterized protein n=1 Tax=Seminavis robusta TaxID=568900 RepID=A0A9N8HY89_9STRA|nr:expressed unknown protein [Seminavis robusta]|eukprot:Sro1952_g307480.1 n/a (273) ;mRNA; f:15918-16842